LDIHRIYYFVRKKEAIMIVKTAQWGNSIGIRIPRTIARKKGIGVDTAVEIDETEDGIVIKPAGRREFSLKELVKGITPQNRHDEADFGRPVGKEII
jgi:antitoxin MazE